MHRLASYRSIQHEPSNKKQYDYVSKSNYSALKSQKDRFTPSQCDSTSQVEGGDLTMKRFDSDAGQSSSSHVMRHNRSEYRAYSARDTDEMLYNIMTIREKGFINDTNPIRTGCFSPEGMHFTLGTNSKSIKICSINEILESFETEEETGDLTSNHANCQIPIAFDQLNYHDGSIYCINWSPNERLIATGSNDKQIKLLVNPLLQEGDTENILELTLAGHTAKIRSV